MKNNDINSQIEKDMDIDLSEYLAETEYIDFHHLDIQSFVSETIAHNKTAIENIVKLYYRVRDEIAYNPYITDADIDKSAFKASRTLKNKKGFCVVKAILLAASGRAIGIPSRLGFADVKNHLSSERLKYLMQTDIFAFHGYTEFYLNEKWVKATPAFDQRLCRVFKIRPLEFDGSSDSVFHEFSADGKRHMEYIKDRGSFADLPYDEMLSVFQELYPRWLARSKSMDSNTADSSFIEDAARENR